MKNYIINDTDVPGESLIDFRRQQFDKVRLAHTLKISEKDSSLVFSEGKTYVFAVTTDGEMIKIYHPDLSCNDFVITFRPSSYEELDGFRKSWNLNSTKKSRENAYFFGQTDNDNHFVC